MPGDPLVNDRSGIGISLGDDGVALVTLDRPHALNAPDRAMHTALVEVWGEIAADASVRAVVLTGAGRAFSAGSDRSLMCAVLDDPAARDEVLGEAERMLLALLDVPVPVVAAVNGAVVGLGCSLVGVCDLVVMAADAFLVDPHVPIGLGGGDGIAVVWPHHVSLLLAKELALLGDRLDAERALAAGIVHRVVARDDVVDTAVGLARRLAAQPAQAVRTTKRVLNAALRGHLVVALPEALAAERESLVTSENRAVLAAALGRH